MGDVLLCIPPRSDMKVAVPLLLWQIDIKQEYSYVAKKSDKKIAGVDRLSRYKFHLSTHLIVSCRFPFLFIILQLKTYSKPQLCIVIEFISF